MNKLVTVLAVLALVVLAVMSTGIDNVGPFFKAVLFLTSHVLVILLPVIGVVYLIQWAWNDNPPLIFAFLLIATSLYANMILIKKFWQPLFHHWHLLP